MRPKVIFIVAASCGILSCTSSADSGRENADVSGVYVREYAYEVSNPESGKKIGMRQVRDSIFVERTEDGYQVSNRKWRMNDYDQEGWVSMAHAEDRPLPTFLASYDDQLGALTSENPRGMQPIFIENGRLFKDRDKEIPYQKVE
jgi:hypothetical protein